jgi:DNA-binding transcriptional MerR regulator
LYVLDSALGARRIVGRVNELDILLAGWDPREQPDARDEDPLLGIGAFAKRSRLSPKALRLYERLDLLAPAEVDEATGYRRYRESQLRAARLVVLLRRLDMPLAEIREIVSSSQIVAVELLAAYWERVELRFAHQRELVAHLRVRLSEGSFAMFDDVKERDIPELLVLTEQRHLVVDELPGFITGSLGRLSEAAGELGGVAAPAFVVYHGEVNQDSDGPVEVCVPVSTESVSLPTRVEPAHKEAYVRITKAQVEFPQILSAYDAVAQWIRANGKSITAAPREVYFTDFTAASLDDEVCDIAFPID